MEFLPGRSYKLTKLDIRTWHHNVRGLTEGGVYKCLASGGGTRAILEGLYMEGKATRDIHFSARHAGLFVEVKEEIPVGGSEVDIPIGSLELTKRIINSL